MKIRNIMRNFLAAALATAALAACDMDLEPTTSVVYDEDSPLFLSATDVTSFNNGLLSRFRGIHYGTYRITSEVGCDGFNAVVDYGNNYGAQHRLDQDFNPGNYETGYTWSANYTAIKDYNIAIAAADNVEDDLKASARTLKGNAFFMRAFSYLTLVRHFGKAYSSTASSDLGVPLVLVYDQLAKPARNTVAECYAQIKTDLDSAAVILGSVEGKIRSQVPTIDAVNALYARYYLDIQDYANAASHAMSVINSAAGYELASNDSTMAVEYTDDNGREPIMQMYASQAEGAGSVTVYSSVGSDDTGKYFSSYFIPTAKLINAYSEDDVRFRNWFTNSLYPHRINGTRYSGPDKASGADFYTFIKYLDNPALHSGTNETGAHAVKPLMIGEMYLIAAEAYAQAGNTDGAAEALNALQTARGASITSPTMANIKDEWFRETVGDGMRLTCLKRWGDGMDARTPQASAAAAYVVMTGAAYDQRTVAADAYQLVWPVPSYDMNINENLVQNPGYSTE